MYITLIFLPILGSIFAGFFGRKVGIFGAQFITCLSLFLSAVLSSIAFFEVGFCNSPVTINLGSWIDSELLTISWEFYFDQLSVTFCIMITYITFLILVYTVYYMDGQPHNQRFFSYLSAFAGFMLVLVTAGNYFVMFVGWEFIGIISYLLISYYFTRIQAVKSGLLALTMNRLGDMILSLAFFALFASVCTLDYSTVFSISPYLNENILTVVALFLFGGACAKSAQIPLHTWLPYSMEASRNVTWNFLLIIFIIYFYSDIAYLVATIIMNITDEGNMFCLMFMPTLFYSRERDNKGRFVKLKNTNEIIALPEDLSGFLVGSLLGDGSLQYSKKDSEGRGTGNVQFAITYKSLLYMQYIISFILPLSLKTEPTPWPNPITGLIPTQYFFRTRSLPVLTLWHSQWYRWDADLNRYIKIIPSNIEDLITELSLAIWIMDDGHASKNGVTLCTECFTDLEIDLLKSVLESKFKLIVTKQRRVTSTGKVSSRLYISSASREQLHSLVLPYFIPSMLYKLNIK